MTKLTIIARVPDALVLAQSTDDARCVVPCELAVVRVNGCSTGDIEAEKRQAKSILRMLTRSSPQVTSAARAVAAPPQLINPLPGNADRRWRALFPVRTNTLLPILLPILLLRC